MVFYAIFWGVVANAQPKWRAFNWPLAFTYSRPRRRLGVAILVLTLVPIFYFMVVFFLIARVPIDPVMVNVPPLGLLPLQASLQVFLVIMAAHAPFAIHRLWISLLEWRPEWYYYREANADRPIGVEPILTEDGKDGPALFRRWSVRNFCVALVHLALCMWAAFALWAKWYLLGSIVVLTAIVVVVALAFAYADEIDQ